MTLRVLDPSHEIKPIGGQRAPRFDSLAGKTVGFISNGKEGTTGFFAHLGQIMQERYGVARVELRVKSNYSAPADAHIMKEARQWDAVVSGLGD
ncbi:MAG: hypothetical protein HOI95_25000 [Chromatiales bacterium]|jgi:hypothetical protein|nr:hypothetical protein [Chromatiales bacterium]